MIFFCLPLLSEARNIINFKDTLSTSAPGEYSDHNLEFTILTAVPAGGYFDIVPPAGFTILSTSTFQARNVELLVNGIVRTSSSTGGANTDTVTITPGSPGSIRYTLNPTTGISNGDNLQLLIGSNTSGAFNAEVSFSTSTGTTTAPQDIGILNASTTGVHEVQLTSSVTAYTDFVIFLIDTVGLGPADTRESVPPFRFNGRPTSTVGGTTLAVELSLETDELAICRYSTTPGVAYNSMVDTFESTGFLVHTQVVSGLANDTDYVFYVRCIDDEDNFNTDDYEISFRILSVPEGDPNTDGDVEGEGTGTGNEGTGSEDNSGGDTGANGTGSNTDGSTSGGGGSGGGGGGGGGGGSGTTAGGGFESTDAPYRSGDGRVIINGFAFPNSDITVLVDGQIAETARADSDGDFSVIIDAIARGVYTFGVYATDENDVKSTTFSTSFSVQGARTSSLSNVNIMPSIVVDPDPAEIGSSVTISGFSIPNAEITIENQKDGSSQSLKRFTTTSNGSGAWSIDVSTNGFVQGTYKVRAKAEQADGVKTNYSDYTFYGVGQEADRQINADLNRDGSVNLIDFSILLFWWNTSGGDSDPPADINGDGDVSLTDFSILLFNWTG